MKANELMARDWVMPLKKLKGIPGKVVTIDGGTDICWIDSKYYSCLFRCSDVEGIPLTPEILEKNGFERDFEDGSLIWVDEQDVTEVVWGGTILTIHGENGHLELDTCMYVHELQHALRLCGIEKEIVL